MRCSRSAIGSAALATVIAIGIAAVYGTAEAQSLAPITLTVPAGQVFEIGLDTSVPQPLYSWILTREREFVTAQRDHLFQTRQSTAGRYTLDVSIQDQGQTRSEHQTFYIDVIDRTVPRQPVQPGSGGQILPVFGIIPPPTASNTIAVPVEGGVVMIDLSQSQGAIARYAIDFDTTRDLDGDGNPANDVDNAGSVSERSGTPVYYLFRPTVAQRNIGIALSGTSGVAAEQRYTIIFSPDAVTPSDNPEQQGGNIRIDLKQNGFTVMPSVNVEPAMLDPAITLIEWDFGDRTRSLLKNPTHTYVAPGMYTITVYVRNITTGDTVFTGTTQAQIAAAAESSSVSSETVTEPSGSSGTALAGILKLMGTIFLLLAIAIGAFLLLKKIKGTATSSLQKKLEEMEGKIFTPETTSPADVIDVAPVPPTDAHLTLRREVRDVPEEPASPPEEEAERDAARTEFKTRATPEVPVVDAGPVPDWMRAAPAPVPATAPAPTRAAKPQSPSILTPPSVTQLEPAAPAKVSDGQTAHLHTTTTSERSAPSATPATPSTQPVTPKTAAQLAAEERERERRRLKRQRYRQNKRERELTGEQPKPASDRQVAISDQKPVIGSQGPAFSNSLESKAERQQSDQAPATTGSKPNLVPLKPEQIATIAPAAPPPVSNEPIATHPETETATPVSKQAEVQPAQEGLKPVETASPDHSPLASDEPIATIRVDSLEGEDTKQ